ncbi:MAG: rhodanese-like domain-containing protein [Euryarchaeota archaeon]|nr:rhodanese-like domain-containing protein [Euryarchaeota archaeon]
MSWNNGEKINEDYISKEKGWKRKVEMKLTCSILGFENVYNLEGPPLLGRLPNPPPLTSVEFKEEMERGAVVVDARTPPAFGGAHIKGSYSIWLEGCTTSNSGLIAAKTSWYSMCGMTMSGKKGILRALYTSMSGNSRAG